MWCLSPMRDEYPFLEPPITNGFLMDVGEDHKSIDCEQPEMGDVGTDQNQEGTNQDQKDINEKSEHEENMYEERVQGKHV